MVCGVNFNIEVDGLFVVAYGVMVCGVDFNVKYADVFCGSMWGGGLWGRL